MGSSATSLAFRYRAATSAGEIVQGVLRAATEREALDELRRQTLVPVAIAPVESARRGASRSSRAISVGASVRTLATMLAAGVPLERALSFCGEHATHPDVASAWHAIRADVLAGRTLTESFGSHEALFGTITTSVVRAGEASGTLDAALDRLAQHLERVAELRARVRSALVYPTLMAVVAGVGVVILLLFVVPRFTAMLAETGDALPLSTRLLIGASQLLISGWWLWFAVVALAIAGTRSWLANPANRQRWHALRLTLPLARDLESKVEASRYTRTLGLMLRSGAAMLPALRTARASVTNQSLGVRLDEATAAVARGDRVATALSGALPPIAVQLLAVGEESGRLDEMCERVATTFDGDVERGLRQLIALIEPVMIVAFGALVGFIALALLQAVYGVNASIR
jgi:type II secretory pathway component PulF